jgi:hypothetical protein
MWGGDIPLVLSHVYCFVLPGLRIFCCGVVVVVVAVLFLFPSSFAREGCESVRRESSDHVSLLLWEEPGS